MTTNIYTYHVYFVKTMALHIMFTLLKPWHLVDAMTFNLITIQQCLPALTFSMLHSVHII